MAAPFPGSAGPLLRLGSGPRRPLLGCEPAIVAPPFGCPPATSTGTADPPRPTPEGDKLDRIAVRAALLHFLQLAAGFEGSGLASVDDPAAKKKDLSCLTKVVRALLNQRKQVFKRRQKAVAQELADLMVPIYAKLSADKTVDRVDEGEVRAVLGAGGAPFEDRWIARLAIRRNALSGDHGNGPVETAQHIVAEKLFGISAEVLSKRAPFRDRHVAPSFFGSRITPSVRS